MATNNLKNAKKNKNDEFYTLIGDIEKELKHYKEQLKGKVVYCNCDDPEWSNFWKYFALNFHHIGIKKLIATHYEEEIPSYKLEYDGKDVKQTSLKQNGDFRSDESIELLKEADIVITNPPFSLFREYVEQLMEHKKDFLIIGNFNSITYKEIFKLFKEDRIWLGYSPRSMEFQTPDGNKKTVNAAWFTNLDTTKRHEELILYKKYNKDDYSKYDNYEAINIDKITDIPCDYNGVMGVPITFMDKYNPEQFEIVGLGNSVDNFTPNKEYINPKKVLKDGKIVNGGAINSVLTIEKDEKPIDTTYYTSDNSNYIIAPYARILIKKRGEK